MIDSHIHADSRSSEDFEHMFNCGVDTAITCAYYPYKLFNETVLLNHLERILYYDTKRVGKYGIDLKVALGIHPTNIIKNPSPIIAKLYEYIENKEIIAIGEIGLEYATPEEIAIFKKQLAIGEEEKIPVIIHTPRKNKLNVLKEIKDIVLETIDSKLVVIDHINSSVIEELIDEDFTLGLTVQPEKMMSGEAIAILEKYGFDKFLLNSDISYKPSDIFSVPKTVTKLRKIGFKKEDIDKISFKNAQNFFKL